MLKTQRSNSAPDNLNPTIPSSTLRGRARHNHWLWVIPLLLLVTGLAARQLNGAFWVDEVITEERAGAPIHGGPFSPAEIWEHTASTTYDQVPGYFWLIAAWDNILGWNEYSTRLLSLLAPLALALAINTWLGMLVWPKYLLYLWVPLALVFGLGVAELQTRGLRPALALLPCVLVGIWSSLTWVDDPVKYLAWDVLHDQLIEQVQPDDAVVFHLSAGLWDGAHQRGLKHYFYDFPHIPNLLWSWPHVSDDVYLQDLPTIAGGKQRIWSAYDPGQRPPRVNKFEDAISGLGFADCGRAAKDPAMWVDLFARQPADMDYRFGSDLYEDSIRMSLLGPMTRSLDGSLLIPLGWQIGENVPLNTYSFAVHILDSGGELAAQVDTGLPPDHVFGCKAVQMPAPRPGDYRISLVVYAWETGARLRALNTAGLLEGERVQLGAITIRS